MNQKLSNWASIAEIVSAVAIVASLLFVGFQIRQSNRTLEVDAYQARMQDISDAQTQLALDPEFSEIYLKYQNSGVSSLTESEFFRMHRWHIGQIRRLQGQYYRYQQGFLERASVDETIQDMAQGAYWIWTDFGLLDDIEIPELRAEIEAYISANGSR
jgi:hypothetical protein